MALKSRLLTTCLISLLSPMIGGTGSNSVTTSTSACCHGRSKAAMASSVSAFRLIGSWVFFSRCEYFKSASTISLQRRAPASISARLSNWSGSSVSMRKSWALERIAPNGLLISWATPPANVPMVASFSVCSSWSCASVNS
ncbi:hypothetical protein D3C78_1307550 [compost metagenome]